jgi:hypothetical protein
MRPLYIVPVALVFAATSASAQPVIDHTTSPPPAYICTPDSQVIKVTSPTQRTLLSFSLPRNRTTNVVPVPGGSDSSGITECVLGPDGLMYAARGYSIIRFPVTDPASSDVVLVANMPATSTKATGLAFNVGPTPADQLVNVDILYVSTNTDVTYAIPNATAPELADVGTAAAIAATGARGVAVDIPGRLVTSSAGVVNAFPWSYSLRSYGSIDPTPYTSTPALDPGGVAVDACGNVLVADKATRSIKRFSGAGAGTTVPAFGTSDIPQHIEVDAGNRLYIVTANSSGLAAKLWVANLGQPVDGCGTATLALWVELSTLLSGPNKLAGLASSRALGVAVEPSNVSITQTFTVDGVDCRASFNFGYSLLDIRFRDRNCSGLGGTLTVMAAKSRFSDVDFTPDVDLLNEMRGMRFSPMGGYVTQYLLTPTGDLATKAAAGTLPEFVAKYGFFTQESIAQPGVAKAEDHTLTTDFDTLVGVDFWDLGSLDPAAGERERDWSKRVVFNKTAILPRGCTMPLVLDNPLDKQNPLFNGPQNIKFAFTASGSDCANGTVRLSIARVLGAVLDQGCNVVGANATYETQEVKKTNGMPGDNLFNAVGNSYQLNLDASLLDTSNPVAQFIATIWGDLAAPKNYCFRMQKQ